MTTPITYGCGNFWGFKISSSSATMPNSCRAIFSIYWGSCFNRSISLLRDIFCTVKIMALLQIATGRCDFTGNLNPSFPKTVSPGVKSTTHVCICCSAIIVVVKKTLRYSNVFFYNPLCRTSVFRNIIMENGIKVSV